MTPVAPINKIVHLSAVDGPGARTAVFTQGCNLACAYCHNPETQRICNNCGICAECCSFGALTLTDSRVLWNSKVCVQCDDCIKICPNFSSPKVNLMTPAGVINSLRGDIPFIRGITVSGGECTLYPEFLIELFTLAKNTGLHCLIDSNGTLNFENYPDLTTVCDGVMLDIKAWEQSAYAYLTGASDNAVVKKNLVWLSQKGLLEEVRVVCVDKFDDVKLILDGIVSVLEKDIKNIRLKLIAFRNNGVRGAMENCPSPAVSVMSKLRCYAESSGFQKVVLT